jgi:hypothetical protein
MALIEDMKRLAQDAIADVGNTYRAVLLQNTGWIAPRPESHPEIAAPHEPDGPSWFGNRRSVEVASPAYDWKTEQKPKPLEPPLDLRFA